MCQNKTKELFTGRFPSALSFNGRKIQLPHYLRVKFLEENRNPQSLIFFRKKCNSVAIAENIEHFIRE